MRAAEIEIVAKVSVVLALSCLSSIKLLNKNNSVTGSVFRTVEFAELYFVQTVMTAARTKDGYMKISAYSPKWRYGFV